VLDRQWIGSNKISPAELRLLSMLIEKRTRRGEKVTEPYDDAAVGSE
jgi:hypothetical protein